MRCVIYSRVSTDAQKREGTSLDTQEGACIEYVGKQGWTVVETLRDTASGFSLDRPGMERVRSLAALGRIDVVLAHALDRLSRKQTHVAILVEEMEDRGVALDFVTEDFEDTAVGQLVRSVKAFAAEFEREKIVERTMRGKRERARSGRLPQGTGAGLYGYRYDPATGRREFDPVEAPVVPRIYERFLATRSIARVSTELNEDGIATKQDARWHQLTVRRVLLNESYTGRTRHCVNGDPPIEIPDATPRLIDDDTWNRAQLILQDKTRHGARRPIRHYALARRVRCRHCSSAMVGQTTRSRGKFAQPLRLRTGMVAVRGRRVPMRWCSRSDSTIRAFRNRGSRVRRRRAPGRCRSRSRRRRSARPGRLATPRAARRLPLPPPSSRGRATSG